MHPIQRFREHMRSGKLAIGASVTFTDPTVTEALAPASDFLWIDTEHNPMSLETVTNHLLAARACGKAALVRVPTSETAYLKRVLDAGADGVIVPQVRSADEVRRVVHDCRYPPQGGRGFGPRRPSNYGRDLGADYAPRMNEQIFVAAQIEHIDAARQIGEIVRIPGLDSIVLGPMDLSGSMGLLGQADHPQVVEVMQTIIDAGRAAGLFVGMGMGTDTEMALRWGSKGVQWVQFGCDFMYMVNELDRLVRVMQDRLG